MNPEGGFGFEIRNILFELCISQNFHFHSLSNRPISLYPVPLRAAIFVQAGIPARPTYAHLNYRYTRGRIRSHILRGRLTLTHCIGLLINVEKTPKESLDTSEFTS